MFAISGKDCGQTGNPCSWASMLAHREKIMKGASFFSDCCRVLRKLTAEWRTCVHSAHPALNNANHLQTCCPVLLHECEPSGLAQNRLMTEMGVELLGTEKKNPEHQTAKGGRGVMRLGWGASWSHRAVSGRWRWLTICIPLWLTLLCKISPFHNNRPASLWRRCPKLTSQEQEQGAFLNGGD